MRKSIPGFTIVELLIVIVVIAILASISMVAYNGIQSRAKQTANQTAVRNYVQALQLMKAYTGSLPTGNNSNSSCLGPEPQPNPCAVAGQTASAESTAATKSALADWGMTNQPGIQGGYTHLVYSSSFYGEPALLWQVNADQECIGSSGRFRIDPNWVDGVKSGLRSGNVTRCYMSLRDL